MGNKVKYNLKNVYAAKTRTADSMTAVCAMPGWALAKCGNTVSSVKKVPSL